MSVTVRCNALSYGGSHFLRFDAGSGDLGAGAVGDVALDAPVGVLHLGMEDRSVKAARDTRNERTKRKPQRRRNIDTPGVARPSTG